MTEAPWIERFDPIGAGQRRVEVLVVHGIFEGAAYARALRARLLVDAAQGPTAELLGRVTLSVRAILAPGYEGREPSANVDEINSEFRRRMRLASTECDPDALFVRLHHSWGGGAAVELWDGGYDDATPDVAILSAPAWADCVRWPAWIGGQILRWRLSRHAARFSYRNFLCRALADSSIPELRELAYAMPDLTSSMRTAYLSFRAVLAGRPLCVQDESDVPRVHFAGKRVIVVQGTKDKAVDGRRAIRRLRELAQRAAWSHVEIVANKLDHFPLLEEPHLLGKTLLNALD